MLRYRPDSRIMSQTRAPLLNDRLKSMYLSLVRPFGMVYAPLQGENLASRLLASEKNVSPCD